MDKKMKLESCPFCGSERLYRSYVISKGRYRITCLDCGIMTPLVPSVEDAVYMWNARAAKRNVGAKDINGKEICIGDKVKMHDFFVGTVGANVWGTYTKANSGRLLYWSNYIDDPEKEIEVVG
jgi:Lar family restriction alleviation protein